MSSNRGRFVWPELMTTDTEAMRLGATVLAGDRVAIMTDPRGARFAVHSKAAK